MSICYAIKKRNDFIVRYSDRVPKFLLSRDIYLNRLPIDTSDIVFIGDSQTQFFSLTEEFNNIHIKNRGIIGDSSIGLLYRLSYITKSKPKKIFIQIGLNDVLHGTNPQIIADNILKIINRIKNDSPLTKIYIQNILPSSIKIGNRPIIQEIRQINASIYRFTQQTNVTYIDLFSQFEINDKLNEKFNSGDDMHLNSEGYKKWVEIVKPYVL